MASVGDCQTSRREARRQSRRDAILQVAAESFLEFGYAGTTMTAIAAALGGSKGTLWSYFPSKEVLFVAVLDRMTEDYRAQLSLILRAQDGPEATLRRFLGEFLRKVASEEGVGLYRLVIAEANRFPEVGRIFFDRGPKRTQSQLADYLSGAMQRGALKRGDPLVAARQLIGLCLAGSHQRLLTRVIDAVTPEQIEEDIDRAMDIFMRAYAVA